MEDRRCDVGLWCFGWSFTAGAMYVDLFCGAVLLIETIALFIWMHKHKTRWLALLPLALALALGAFALASYMWDIYAQSVGYPHFPPDLSQGIPVPRPYGYFTTALLFALVLVPGVVRSLHMRQVLAGYRRRVRKGL